MLAVVVGTTVVAEAEFAKRDPEGYARVCKARAERRERESKRKEPDSNLPLYMLAAFLVGGAVL